jgi:hypothetical protein
MKAKEVMIGQVFRPTEIQTTATPRHSWAVDKIFAGTDSVQYARLINIADRSLVKTVSTATLTDPGRFVPLA